MNRTADGFTLIELMIALAITAILLGVALPAFSSSIAAVRASDARSALLTSLMMASRQGLMTGTRTVLCPSPDGNTCTGKSPDWSRGWIVFQDNDGNRERAGSERIFHQQPALLAGVHLRSTTGRTRVVFQGNGGNAGSNVTFTLCDGRGPAKAQSLVLNNQGRLRAGTPTAANIAATCVP